MERFGNAARPNIDNLIMLSVMWLHVNKQREQ